MIRTNIKRSARFGTDERYFSNSSDFGVYKLKEVKLLLKIILLP